MAKGGLGGGTKVVVSGRSIVWYFESLPDPRHHRNRRHLLVDVITIAVCGAIVGCNGTTVMGEGERGLVEVDSGVAHWDSVGDCIRLVLTALKPEAFRECFLAWIASLEKDDSRASPLVAIDGKTLWRSHESGEGLGPLHLVSAWATKNGLLMGQAATRRNPTQLR